MERAVRLFDRLYGVAPHVDQLRTHHPGTTAADFLACRTYSLYVYLVHVFFVVAWKAFIPAGFMPTSWMQLLVLFGVALVMVLVIISPPMVRLLRPLVEIDVKRVQNTKAVKGESLF